MKRPALRRTKCECCDPGCPAKHGTNQCSKRTVGKIYRIDMEDASGVAMCRACMADALEYGMFHAPSPNHEYQGEHTC